MPCYGGTCRVDCPQFIAHHPAFVKCDSCGEEYISLLLEDGHCPKCGALVDLVSAYGKEGSQNDMG